MPKCLSSSNIKWTFRESSKIFSVTSSAFYFFSCKRKLFSTEADLILVRLIPASLPPSRKSLLRGRHCITIRKIKTYKRGGGTQVGRMRRKRTRRKEGAPLTNNHSRSITTNDSSVAEDETADAARASRERRAGKSSLVSCRSSASETHETELRHEAGRAADSSRLVCIKQCAQLRCIPAVPFARSLLVTPDASRQYPANVPSHLPILSHFCVCLGRPSVQPTRTHDGLAFGADRWWLLYRNRRDITIVTTSYHCAKRVEWRMNIPISIDVFCMGLKNCEEKNYSTIRSGRDITTLL